MIYGIQEVEVDLFRTSFVHPPDQEASAGRRPPASGPLTPAVFRVVLRDHRTYQLSPFPMQRAL